MNVDMSNAELGVSEADAAAAKGRLSANKGFEEQQNWSQSTMGEKTLGYVLVLCFVVLGIVWMFDMSGSIRYGATGLIVFGISFWTFNVLREKSRLKEYRNRQVATHANEN